MTTNRSIPAATVVPVLTDPDVVDTLGRAHQVRISQDHRGERVGKTVVAR
ncbi:hypothetical protein [Actinoplanes sp. NPDC026619]